MCLLTAQPEVGKRCCTALSSCVHHSEPAAVFAGAMHVGELEARPWYGLPPVASPLCCASATAPGAVLYWALKPSVLCRRTTCSCSLSRRCIKRRGCGTPPAWRACCPLTLTPTPIVSSTAPSPGRCTANNCVGVMQFELMHLGTILWATLVVRQALHWALTSSDRVV